MSDPTRDPAALPALPRDLVAVPNIDFVDEAMHRLDLTLQPADKDRLTLALSRGVNKGRIWQTLARQSLARRALAVPPPRTVGLPGHIMAMTPAIVSDDLLVAFAPDDDAAFVDHAFVRLLGRDATTGERATLLESLARSANRHAILTEIAALATRHASGPVRARIVRTAPFTLLNEANGRDLSLIRYIGDGDYLVSDQLRMTTPVLKGLE